MIVLSSEQPSQNSITMKKLWNAGKRPYTRTMFSCSKDSTMSASRWNRSSAVESYTSFLQNAERGEWAERVRRILEQIAPEVLPPARKPLETPPEASSADDPTEGDAS